MAITKKVFKPRKSTNDGPGVDRQPGVAVKQPWQALSVLARMPRSSIPSWMPSSTNTGGDFPVPDTIGSSRSRLMAGLQRSLGNARISRLYGDGVQAKLNVSAPSDQYEQEAERIASTMTMTPGKRVRLGISSESTYSKRLVQRRVTTNGTEIGSDIEKKIQQARSGRHTLPESTRQPMEQSFGADFSEVQVHTDANADRVSQDLNARAFTTGQDIFFKQGEYNPRSTSGEGLIAHELTHVVQQTGLLAKDQQRKCSLIDKEKPITHQLLSGNNNQSIQRTIDLTDETIPNWPTFIDDVVTGRYLKTDPEDRTTVSGWDRRTRQMATRILYEIDAEQRFTVNTIRELLAMIIRLVDYISQDFEELLAEMNRLPTGGYGLGRTVRPTNLPVRTRQATATGAATPFVEELAAHEAWVYGFRGETETLFLGLIDELANESGSTFAVPARNFPASTAWGVFQWQSELWRQVLRSQGVETPTAPWNASMFDEITIPIRFYARLYQDILQQLGCSPQWAAYGVMLWHAAVQHYNRWLRDARRIGPQAAERRIVFVNPNTGEQISRTVRRRLSSVGIDVESPTED